MKNKSESQEMKLKILDEELIRKSIHCADSLDRFLAPNAAAEQKIVSDIFKDILISYRVPLLHLSVDSENLADLDFHFREQLFESFDYTAAFLRMTAPVSRENALDYIDSFGFHYLIFEAPDYTKEKPFYIFLGPFLYQKYSDADFYQLMHEKNIPISYLPDIKSYFFRITVISDMLSWQFMLNRIASRYTGYSITFHTMDDDNVTAQKTSLLSHEFTPKSVVAFSAIEARYEVEAGLIRAVTAGNIRDALYYYNMFMGFTLEPRNSDLLRNGKDMVIAVNTFLRKAVQAAYVHPLYIDALNQKLTQDIENCTTTVQLNSLVATMIRKYCLLVKSYSRSQYSQLIRDCLNYIDFHYQEPLSLDLLAEKYTVSKNYLSALFHKEVKMTLTDYINSTRIRQSILLLNTTSLSMQDIAEQCGFSDANYFTRTFRKYHDMSPLKYRKSLHE